MTTFITGRNHENPSIPNISFSSTSNTTTFNFSHVDTEFELSVYDLVLDNPAGSLRTVSLEVENTTLGTKSRNLKINIYSTARNPQSQMLADLNHSGGNTRDT